MTDEAYLFLFTIEPTVVTSGLADDFEPFDLEGQQNRIVADAEKAFVSLLKPQYNVTKFKNYRKGNDDLYGSNCADLIIVDGDQADLGISAVDFPGSDRYWH